MTSAAPRNVNDASCVATIKNECRSDLLFAIPSVAAFHVLRQCNMSVVFPLCFAPPTLLRWMQVMFYVLRHRRHVNSDNSPRFKLT